jgi:hypothetical protein
LVVAAVCLLAIFVVRRINNTVPPVPDTVRRLPTREALVLHVDVARLRQSGLDRLLAASPVEEEADYRSFVSGSGFDWKSDLDSVTASRAGETWFVFANGRFDWEKLRSYFVSRRGSCHNGVCKAPSATPGKIVSFFPQGSRTLAMVTSSSGEDVYYLTKPPVRDIPFEVPASPLWVSFPGKLLAGDPELPAGTRLFAKALATTKQTTAWLAQDGSSLQLMMRAECPSADAANSLHSQLAGVTAEFKKYFERLGQTPNASDLSGVLLQGTFEVKDTAVLAKWPVNSALLASMAGGTL